LQKQIDAVNDALDNVKVKVNEASEKTVKYVKQINESESLEKVPVPRIQPMTICMHDLQNVLQIYNDKH
jgi:hypothetical protein